MAVVADPNRGRNVARPPWVRRHDNQHEGVVAGIMLALVIVGIAVFLFWGPMLRLVASSPLFEVPGAPTERPAEGAVPPGPPVVVTLDRPVLPPPSSVKPPPGPPDQLVVLDPSLVGAPADGRPDTSAGEAGPTGASSSDAQAASEAAAARDADETARAAQEARAASRAADSPPPTARPLATPTAVAPTPAAPTATTRSAAATGRRARVYRTGGRGVVMYSAPRQGARLPAGLLEGTVVSVLGVSGEWTQVEGSGRSGWVKSEFLTPVE